jgi:hypothetical protein
MVYGPDNFIWFTEKVGKISRLNPSTGQISSLLAMKTIPVISDKKQVPVLQSLKEGFTYAFGFPPILHPILMTNLVKQGPILTTNIRREMATVTAASKP